MIILKELKWKNFISYGNKFTKYDFKTGITRISGVNGQGKSTIVDAIYYGLFGKPYRKTNIPKIVNSINKKNLLVELTFEKNGNEFIIQRGIKPDIFLIKKNGTAIDQDSNKKTYQEYLEQDILGFTEDIFQQIGIKSLTRYESFLTLPKGRKRHIVENIFGIGILSEMKELNTQMYNDTETHIYNLRKDENKYELLLKQENKNIENLKQIRARLEEDLEKVNDQKKEEIKLIEKEIWKNVEGLLRIDKCISERINLDFKIDHLEESKQIIVKQVEKTKLDKKINDNRIEFVKGFCPTCPNIKKMEDVNSFDATFDGLLEGIAGLQDQIKVLLEDRNKKQRIIDNKPFVERNLRDRRTEIKKIKDSMQDQASQVSIDYNTYDRYSESLKEIKHKSEKENDRLVYMKVIFSLLSDDGVKSYIIKKYLPLLNKLMNTYLQKFSIDLELCFNSELEIEIKTKFKEDYSYDNFSEGEKKKINLAMMFTFLEFCKLKHSDAAINILILDEFSAGLDPEGENVMYDILNDIVEKEQKEILTISHSALIDPEKLDRQFHVTRERGFSQFILVENN